MKENRGFSLIELIISVTILSIGALALMRVFSVTARLNQKSAERERIQYVADQTMEQVLATDLDEVFQSVYQEAQGKSSGIGTISFGGIPYSYDYASFKVTNTKPEQPSYVFYKKDKETADGLQPLLTTGNKDYGVRICIRTSAVEDGTLPNLAANDYTMPLIYDLQPSATQLTLDADDFATDQAIVQQLLKQLSDVAVDDAGGAITSESAATKVWRYIYIALSDDGGNGLRATVHDVYTTDSKKPSEANVIEDVENAVKDGNMFGQEIKTTVHEIYSPEIIEYLTSESGSPVHIRRYRNPFAIMVPSFEADGDIEPQKIIVGDFEQTASEGSTPELLVYDSKTSNENTNVLIKNDDGTGKAGNLIHVTNTAGYSQDALKNGSLEHSGEVLPRENIVYDIRVDVVPVEEGELNPETALDDSVYHVESTKTQTSNDR